MKAIILAGGFGTRLKSVLAETPKPMAPIHGKPFLAYLIEYLAQQGVHEVVLSVHYLREQIQTFFNADYAGVKIRYAIEESPLGTGGAIVHALREMASNEPVFVLNGDTFVKLDYRAMYAQHQAQQADLTMALRSVDDCSRYGKVVVSEGVINDFREKGEAGPGRINAGVYLLQPDLFARFNLPTVFSFENEFVQPNLATLKPQAFAANDYFIDIGIPEDYAKATTDLTVWPKLSVVMPVYNREDTLEKAIKSLLDQQYPNLELIIIDGASTDNTINIIKKYEAHIAYWHSAKDGGSADAQNTGIARATGEAIGLLMADDWYEPDTLKKVGEALLAHPQAEIISFGGRIVAGTEGQYKVLQDYQNFRHLELGMFNTCYHVTGICFRFIRRHTYERLGPYLTSGLDNARALLANDKEYLFRAVLSGVSNVVIDHLGYTHFAHHESTSFGNERTVMMRHCREHIWIANQYLQNKALTLKQRLFMRMWRNDQAARLVLFNLLDKNIPGAFGVIKTAWASDLIWPFAFVYTTGWVMMKRIIRRVRQCA